MEWVAGHEGTALNFTGANNYVRVENSPELSPTKGITIAAWINPSWTGNSRILQKGQRDSQYRLLREWGNNFVFHLAGVTNGKLDGFSVPPIGEWTHVAATYDGSAMKVYYNGKVVGKLDANGALATTTEPLYIGTKHAEAPVDDELSGILDDIRIYNYALSEADIAAIYAGKELGRGKNWIPVLVIVVIAAVAAGLAIKKKKVTT